MTVDEWCETVRLIAEDTNQQGSEPIEQRALIFGLWRAFMDSPSEIQSIFETIEDDQLSRNGTVVGSEIGKGIPLQVPDHRNLQEFTRFAAFLLRGLEQAFVGLGGKLLFPRTVDELKVVYREEAGFLLPFTSRFRKIKRWPTYFQRRGLIATRCIPGRLPGGEVIDLCFTDQSRDTGTLTCVAQVFERCSPLDAHGMPIDFSGGGPFVFHGLADHPLPELNERMREIGFSNPAVDIVVFPELTMNDERRESLRKLLQEKPWDAALQQAPAIFVLGGSWHHQREDGQFENRAPLFDGNGIFLGWHMKNIAFRKNELVEAIVPSNNILVAVSPTLTVAVAICLDFCQAGRPRNSYDELDVDLILVASMGGETTLGAHQAKASQYWANRKTATFIAQQSDTPSSPYGYIASVPAGEDLGFYEKIQGRSAMRILKRGG